MIYLYRWLYEYKYCESSWRIIFKEDVEYNIIKNFIDLLLNGNVDSDYEVISLDNISVKGYITSNSIDDYDLDVNVDGIMVLPSSLTLEPTDYKFSIKIEGNIDELLKEINETLKKNQNTIDILPIIWENILMEIPIRVVGDKNQNLRMEGDGWKLITEEEKKLNPELQKLKDLLKWKVRCYHDEIKYSIIFTCVKPSGILCLFILLIISQSKFFNS